MSVNFIGRKIDGISNSYKQEGAFSSQRLSPGQARSYERMTSWLNDKDRDVLYLIFVSGKKQKEVEDLLNRSQPCLCYDIKRIRKRLRLIYYLQSEIDVLLTMLRENRDKFTTEELDILTAMYYTTSFTMSAKVLNLPQVRIRYLYDKCLRRMVKLQLWPEYEIFSIIRHSLNGVRRVELREIS